MTHTRCVFVKANRHADIVSQSLDGFLQLISAAQAALMIGNTREALAA